MENNYLSIYDEEDLMVETMCTSSPQPCKQKSNNEKFQHKYRVPSTRAQWHDYNGGLYFVTICTANREHYFGEIRDGIMHLSDIGKYADEQFRNVQNHYPYAENPLFIIMPNHIHCITIINCDYGVNNTRVETMCTSSLRQHRLYDNIVSIKLVKKNIFKIFFKKMSGVLKKVVILHPEKR